MKENPYPEDKEQMKELLQQYENLRNGRRNSFLEEESFEKIINYFEEKEEFAKAMEAADLVTSHWMSRKMPWNCLKKL
jgi:hypothetical protein